MKKGITLIELLIACILLGIIILAVISIQTYSRHHLTTSDRRARLQNDVSFALELITKYGLQASGNSSNPAFAAVGTPVNGFRMRVDPRASPTFSNLNDDLYLTFVLNDATNRFSCVCSPVTPGPGAPACPLDCPSSGVDLSNKIVPGVTANSAEFDNATKGFYLSIQENGSVVDLGLNSRWNPNQASGVDNPQVEMRTKVYATGASAR